MSDFLHVSDVAREATLNGDPLTPAGIRAAADRGDLDAIRTPGGVRIFTREAVEIFLARRRRERDVTA